jgi:hypothetical protein
VQWRERVYQIPEQIDPQPHGGLLARTVAHKLQSFVAVDGTEVRWIEA